MQLRSVSGLLAPVHLIRYAHVVRTSTGVLCIIELTYKVELAQIDAHMAAHMRFLRKHYADGTFLLSGRKIPREGGIILAAGKSREEVEAIAREDPFGANGLAEFRVIEFRASQRADDLAASLALL
jgi:uncharacterized protein YciI